MSCSNNSAINHPASPLNLSADLSALADMQAVGGSDIAASATPAPAPQLPRYDLKAIFISMTFVILYSVMVMVASTSQA